MLIKNDIVIMLSYSGGTEAIKKVLLVLRKMKVKVIVMTGKIKAKVWQSNKCVINCSIKKETCPYNLAPTSSIIAMLVQWAML